MLEFIRKKANSTTFKVLLGLLALTFVFCFGIFDIIRRWTGRDYVIKVGKAKITPVLFELEKAKKLNMLRAQNKTVDEKAELNRVVHNVIWENIIDQASSDYGFIVSEETIKKYIAGMSIFRDQDGRFNAGRLRGFLSNINVSEPMFIEFSGKDIKNALIKAPFKYVSPYRSLDCFMKSALEKRTMSFVEIDPNKTQIQIPKEISDEELENFYSEHSDLFTVEEARDFSVVELPEDDILKTVSVTEEEIRDVFDSTPAQEDDRPFDERKDEIRDELTQERLQTAIDDKTRQIEDALMSGENFDEVVKKFNLSVRKMNNVTALDNGGKTDSTVKSTYRDDILTIAFSTEEGSDSSFAEALNEKNQRVLWLVHVDSITPKHVASFDTVKDKVKKKLIEQKIHDAAVDIAKEICEEVKSGAIALSAAAKKHHKELIVSKAFDRAGNLVVPGDKNKKDNNDNKKGKSTQKEEKKNPKDEKIANLVKEFVTEAFSAGNGAVFYKEVGNAAVVAQVESIVPAGEIDSQTMGAAYSELNKETADDLYQQLVEYLSKEKYEVRINYEMLEKTGVDSSGLEDIF